MYPNGNQGKKMTKNNEPEIKVALVINIIISKKKNYFTTCL